jgi:hypothetical protein
MSMGYSETFHRFHKSLLFPVLRITPPHVFRYYQGMSEAEALAAAIQDATEKLAEHSKTLAAVVMEPLMQGAAGMWAQPWGIYGRCGIFAGATASLTIGCTGFGARENIGLQPRRGGRIYERQRHHRRILTAGDADHGRNLAFLASKDFKTFFITLYRQSVRRAVAIANLESSPKNIIEKMVVAMLQQRL